MTNRPGRALRRGPGTAVLRELEIRNEKFRCGPWPRIGAFPAKLPGRSALRCSHGGPCGHPAKDTGKDARQCTPPSPSVTPPLALQGRLYERACRGIRQGRSALRCSHGGPCGHPAKDTCAAMHPSVTFGDTSPCRGGERLPQRLPWKGSCRRMPTEGCCTLPRLYPYGLAGVCCIRRGRSPALTPALRAGGASETPPAGGSARIVPPGGPCGGITVWCCLCLTQDRRARQTGSKGGNGSQPPAPGR